MWHGLALAVPPIPGSVTAVFDACNGLWLQCPALREGASSLPLLLLGLNTLSQVPSYLHAVLLCHRSLPAEMTNVSPLRLSSLWVLVAGW